MLIFNVIRLYDLAAHALKKGVPVNDADKNGKQLLLYLLFLVVVAASKHISSHSRYRLDCFPLRCKVCMVL
jgi:hypothetical protein